MSVGQRERLELRLERVIRAPRERVFAAWTEPEQLQRWSAPEGLKVVDGATDLRVGGEWRVVMATPDGTTSHEAFGRYREVTPPERLVYTHAWRMGEGSTPETVLTVEFEAVGADRTRVVLTQTGFETGESRDSHVQGWSSALDNLERLISGGEAAS